MSFLQKVYPCPMRNAGVEGGIFQCPSKRGLHRSPSYAYMGLWEKIKIDYNQCQDQNPLLSSWPMKIARHHFYHSPELVYRIIRTEAASQIKGNCTFLHATPASTKILTKLHETLFQAQQKSNPYFKYLRSPASIYGKMSREQACAAIPKEKPCAPIEGLASLSYALTSGVAPLESAASWGFCNHSGKGRYFFLDEKLSKLFEESICMRLKPSISDYFRLKFRVLVHEYSELPVGDFLVLGVPAEKVDRFIYDAMPFNIPSGKKASEVANDPGQHLDTLSANQTHMATLLLYEETMNPDCGISMVNANDTAEVDAFCSGLSLKSMGEIEAFEGLTSPEPTDFEIEQNSKRKQLDAQLQTLISELNVFITTGHPISALRTEPSESSPSATPGN